MPLASIIIPTFNRENLIEKTIKSAISQSFKDIEVIVIDNASTDNTYPIALQMSGYDNRIKVFKNESNVGPVLNWLHGANKATSPFSKLLFSDDLLSPNFIEKCLHFLDDPKCAFVYTPAIIGTEDWEGKEFYRNFIGDTKIKSSPYVFGTTFVEHLFPVSPCSCISRTEDLKRNIHLNLEGFEMGEYASTGAGVDWLFHPLTAIKYEYVQYIDSCEVFFRAHESNLSSLPIIHECYSNAKKFLISAFNLKN